MRLIYQSVSICIAPQKILQNQDLFFLFKKRQAGGTCTFILKSRHKTKYPGLQKEKEKTKKYPLLRCFAELYCEDKNGPFH